MTPFKQQVWQLASVVIGIIAACLFFTSFAALTSNYFLGRELVRAVGAYDTASITNWTLSQVVLAIFIGVRVGRILWFNLPRNGIFKDFSLHSKIVLITITAWVGIDLLYYKYLWSSQSSLGHFVGFIPVILAFIEGVYLLKKPEEDKDVD